MKVKKDTTRRLTQEQKDDIILSFTDGKMTKSELARKHDCSAGAICWILRDIETDKVICKVCNKKYKAITALHLKKHNMTFDKYVEKFGAEDTCCEATRKERKDSLIGREIHWADKISNANKEAYLRDPEHWGKSGFKCSAEEIEQRASKLRGQNRTPKQREYIGKKTKEKLDELGIEPWNKGKTKYTSNKVAGIGKKISKVRIEGFASGRIEVISNGKYKCHYRDDLEHLCRSSWEANFARSLRCLDVSYEYEPRAFMLIGTTYTPDFKIYTNMSFIGIKSFDYIDVKGHAKSVNEWVCPCKSCATSRAKIKAMKDIHDIDVIIIGREEYKTLRALCAPIYPNWEYDYIREMCYQPDGFAWQEHRERQLVKEAQIL